MNHITKTTTLGIATAIATVTLVLATAGIVVSMMMPIVQTAHASCITSPKGDIACSGGSDVGDASTSSISRGSGGSSGTASGPSGSASVSGIAGGSHRSFSHNFQEGGNCADTTCSGN